MTPTSKKNLQTVLIVKDASPEDDDEYICIAENRAGAAKASAKVQVHCKFISLLNNINLYTFSMFYKGLDISDKVRD